MSKTVACCVKFLTAQKYRIDIPSTLHVIHAVVCT